jgi:hypothetical protein
MDDGADEVNGEDAATFELLDCVWTDSDLPVNVDKVENHRDGNERIASKTRHG